MSICSYVHVAFALSLTPVRFENVLARFLKTIFQVCKRDGGYVDWIDLHLINVDCAVNDFKSSHREVQRRALCIRLSIIISLSSRNRMMSLKSCIRLSIIVQLHGAVENLLGISYSCMPVMECCGFFRKDSKNGLDNARHVEMGSGYRSLFLGRR
jgi:hypothetical protein